VHLVHTVLTVKGSVSTQQEIGNNAQSPHVNRLAVARLLEDFRGL
jgi:hypothetical protein